MKTGNWTEEQNDRRCDLIDKEINDSLSVIEKCELEELQRRMRAYIKIVAPLPIKEVKAFHEHLKRKKMEEDEKQDGVFDSIAQHWTDHDGVPILPIETNLKD